MSIDVLKCHIECLTGLGNWTGLGAMARAAKGKGQIIDHPKPQTNLVLLQGASKENKLAKECFKKA